jgi:hypothetical protein
MATNGSCFQAPNRYSRGGLVTIMREQENAPHDPAGLNRIMD